MSRLVRTEDITPDQAPEVMDQFDRWREDAAELFEVSAADIKLAGNMVRTPRPKLTTADAIHLAACKRTGQTFVTHDTILLQIAAREQIRCISTQ